jgi:PAS domain S-box-containing protein
MSAVAAVPVWPPQDSLMAGLIRTHEWSSSPLGALATWEDSTKTAVTAMLDSPIASILLLGPELRQVYNDAYAPILAHRHPTSIGQRTQDCWHEVWKFNQPIYEQVRLTGKSVCFDDQRFDIEIDGFLTIKYFTVTYSPTRDASGAILGILVLVVDTTRRVIAEEQNAVLLSAALFSAEQFDQMFQQTPGFIALLRGPEHMFTMANPAFDRLLNGRTVVGQSVHDAIPEAAQQGFIDLLDRAYRTGIPFKAAAMPFTLHDAGSHETQVHYLDFIYQPLKGKHGEIVGTLVEGSDVTDQYLAERDVTNLNIELKEKVALLEKADRLQAFRIALGNCHRKSETPSETVARSCELLGQYLQVDRALFCEVAEQDDSFFVRNDWNSVGTASIAGERRSLDSFGPTIVSILRNGRIFLTDDAAGDARTVGFDDTYAGVSARAILAIPLVKTGALTTILALHHKDGHQWSQEELDLAKEMAERTWSAVQSIRAHEQLQIERDQHKYILDSVSEGFALLDKDWNFVSINAFGAGLTRHSAESLIGNNHWEILPETVGTDLERLYRRVRETGLASEANYLHRYPSGELAWIELRVSVAQNDCLAIFFQDITSRVENEEKLREADRMKDEFLAMLAHELRNPLAPVSVAASLLTNEGIAPERVAHIGGIIKRQVSHMTGLIDDLLDVSRVTRGLVALQCVPMDIKSIVADAVEQVRPLIEARNHQFTVELPPGQMWVNADKKRMVQVVANLLSNSAKYTPVGGEIMLSIKTDERNVVITVADNGVGMDAKLIDKAFELFAQAEQTPDRTQGGLGIGLALVKSLVELHDGKVAARSQGLQRGSEFIVELPFLQQAMISSHPEVTIQTNIDTRTLQILVVEDNVDAAEMLSMFLEGCGHSVQVEHLGRTALERVNTTIPDVCILDIGLPDIDGNLLAKSIRQMVGTDATVLIALTGYGQQTDKTDAYAAGFDHHLVKPVNIEALKSLLSEIGTTRRNEAGTSSKDSI